MSNGWRRSSDKTIIPKSRKPLLTEEKTTTVDKMTTAAEDKTTTKDKMTAQDKMTTEDKKTALDACVTGLLRMTMMHLPTTMIIIIDRMTDRPLAIIMDVNATMTIIEAVAGRKVITEDLPSSPQDMNYPNLNMRMNSHPRMMTRTTTESWWKSCLEPLCLFVEALKHGQPCKTGTLPEPHASAACLV
jgi:hypothetical protein